MTDIDWSKAPDWANAVVASPCGNKYFVEAWGVNSKRQPIGDKKPDDIGADMTSKGSVWTLVEERPTDWTGEGLPPVGVECEAHWESTPKDVWHPIKVLAHDEGVVVFRWKGGESKGAYSSYSQPYNFRPIRTPEQIAADERLHNVRNACTAIADTLDGLRGKTKVERAALAVVEAMIDAGYTRFEQ